MIIIWIKVKIIYPIKALWNYYINNDYNVDNVRNRALMKYCEKVMMDFSYQPDGVYETFFENRLQEAHEEVIEFLKSYVDEDEEIDWNKISYEDKRPFYIAQIYEKLLQKVWVKE